MPQVHVVGSTLPAYAHPGDAGADLTAAEAVTLKAGGGRALIATGIRIAIPEGFAGFVLPRSGLALKHGVTCLNTPGLIDSGYRGEVKVLLVNTDPTTDYKVEVGDRIAQLVIQAGRAGRRSLPSTNWTTTSAAPGGFGSTGA